MTGKLQKNSEGNWVIWHKKDFDLCATDGGDIPIHEQHSFWLKIWGKEGSEMTYEIDEQGKAILKSKNSMVSYPQD